MTISQQDGKATSKTGTKLGTNRGFKIKLEKAKALDRVFGKWGLRWRKDRWYPKEELESVIAEGHADDDATAMRWLEINGKPGYLCTNGPFGSGGSDCYKGRQTIIQSAHEVFMSLVRSDSNHPYVQTNWPGFPTKHDHMEHQDVWDGGLAPPRIRAKKGAAGTHELIDRAPAP